MKMAKILVLAGSTREASTNRKLARHAAEALGNAGLEAIFADLRDYPMPLYDGDLEAAEGLPPAAKTLKDLARDAEGFAVASPEYNGAYSAVLKNAIDWMSRAEDGERALAVFSGKPVALMSASPGAAGGARVLREMRHLFEGLRMEVTEHQVSIAKAGEAFDAEGRLTRAADIESLGKMTEELAGAIRKKQI
jgi:chromate reductase